MSQWNNSYAYNNQYQGHNTWNGDMNGQYQAYYPNRQFDTSNQYVSFNEFLAQMQTAGAPAANPVAYNNIQYPNYPNNQYSYQNIPSQSAQIDHSYGANVTNNIVSLNNPEVSQVYHQLDPHHQKQYDSTLVETNKYNEMVFNSKLTPTATEFVPKSSGVDSTNNSSSIPQLSKPSTSKIFNENVNISNSSSQNKPSSSETNWRERPQSSQQNGSSNVEEPVDRQNKFYRQNRNGSANNYDKHSQNNDSNNQSHESYYRNQESNKSNNANGHNQDGNGSRYGTDTNNDNSETSTRQQERSRRNDSNNYQRSNNRYYDTNNREQSRNTDSYRGDEGQSRSNSKHNNKNKENDAGRMFYNSSIPKGSQDVRNGRGDGSGRRGWAGSQRLRTTERNTMEDEQYANTYLQYREEKLNKEPKSSPIRNKNYNNNKNGTNSGANTEMTQRERLSEQLDKGTLECLVCCERVKQTDSVWWCSNCYHVLHLKCIRKWALSSVIEGKWRCPACQNASNEIPTEYRCMCGAVRNPEYQRGSGGAHTCGRACQRPRSCPHPCTLLCHPGPCPPCQATINKHCGCGTETRSILCSSKLPQVCGRVCHKTLDCGAHTCQKDCHEGPCDECKETVTQVCHCAVSKSRVVSCARGVTAQWACGAECGRVLACGAHVCRRECHPPPCSACPLRPENVPTCPCGKTRIQKGQRKSCTDPIPLCDNICAKPLRCGPDDERHFCKEKCHDGECPVCPDSTHLQCRCGHSTREVPCRDLPEARNSVTCQRKCNKKLSCGRHRCREVCCAGGEHLCTVVCGRSLFCQQHRCEEYCHAGHCAPCPRLNFEEVRCECGASVLLPPVRCGARPPACDAPCVRARSCGHPPHHSCHVGDCPPCVVLTARVCYGGHEERKTIPCSQEEFSCGLPCGKPLPCGKHTCIKICHKGPCDTGKCTQPCMEKRPSCGHACAAACHASAGGACPSAAPCRRSVRATCPCGRRSAERACCDNARDLARIMSQLAVSKMQEGGSVDLSDVQRPVNMLKTLECDDECRQEARSRQLALALQIRNPDVSAKLAPRYSEHVRATAAREPAFANHVHDRLAELVQRAKNSKQKTRSHSFPSMNRQKRQFIHEMCEHFGCESVAYDAEPNRNVVATADREKSWLPAMSVLEVLAREAGKRRVPGPVLRAPAAPPAAPAPLASNKSTSGWATLTSTNAWAARSARSAPQQQPQPPQQQPQQQPQPQPAAPKIDYFDNPPEN